MKQMILQAVMLIMLIFLPSCGRLVDWGTDLFYQGRDTHYQLDRAREYIQSVIVLDEFTTVGMFDALWLSDEVIALYAHAYAHRNCLSNNAYADMLACNLSKNKKHYMFYVLTLNSYPLGDPYFEWAIHLLINSHCYSPLEVKKVDLAPEYSAMFGFLLTKSKTAYLITFDPTDEQGNLLIPQDDCLILQFKSVQKNVYVSWDMNKKICNNTPQLQRGFYN